jgi:hypothetical protein
LEFFLDLRLALLVITQANSLKYDIVEWPPTEKKTFESDAPQDEEVTQGLQHQHPHCQVDFGEDNHVGV